MRSIGLKRLSVNQVDGFTLIELLIVIAIILILIAIALPNFMHARIRAKVLQTQADMKSIDTAIHMYANDYPGGFSGRRWGCNNYAWWWDCDLVGTAGSSHGLHGAWVMVLFGNFNPGVRYMGQVLTSPTPYLDKIPIDYFNTAMGATPGAPGGLNTFGYPASAYINITLPEANTGDGVPWGVWWQQFMMNEHPHLKNNFFFHLNSSGPDYLWWSMTHGGDKLYSPTNGTMSDGDLWRFSSGVTVP